MIALSVIVTLAPANYCALRIRRNSDYAARADRSLCTHGNGGQERSTNVGDEVQRMTTRRGILKSGSSVCLS
jgi:hypothetical protein